jgi:FemAB-related protein (PEP-CTERM system-associated)
VEVVELQPQAVSHGWDEYVERHAGGTLFHTSWWRDLLWGQFPHQPRFLEARREGRRVGLLPLYETRSILSGKALYSVPYGVYGGPLGDDSEAVGALIDAVRAMREAGGHRFAELRCLDPIDPSLPCSELYATFVRELPEDPDDCLGTIPRKSRATTRQARDREGLRFGEAPDGVEQFHRLFVLNKSKLGSPAFGSEFFEALLGFPRNAVRLHFVRRGEELLVAVLSFLYRATWNPYYSGSVPNADRLGASNFMYWKLMEQAVREGFRRFDFGRSRVDTGPYHFKRHMGFEPTPLQYAYVLGPGQSIPAINPSNPAFSLPRRIIQKLPYAIARRVGPPLMNLVP